MIEHIFQMPRALHTSKVIIDHMKTDNSSLLIPLNSYILLHFKEIYFKI